MKLGIFFWDGRQSLLCLLTILISCFPVYTNAANLDPAPPPAAPSPTARQQIERGITDAVAINLAQVFKNTQVRTDINVSNLDARLKLTPCTTKLQILLPPMQRFNRRTNAKVRCDSPTPWAVNIPVSIRAYMTVVVASNQLLRGHHISPGDIILAEIDIEKLRFGYFTHAEPIIGMQLKRNLNVNAPFTPKLLRFPIVIQRGEQVTISALASALKVKTNGIALGSGSVGDKIQIRNSKSQRVVEGKITSPGHVAVNM